jgi:hypothetical protein
VDTGTEVALGVGGALLAATVAVAVVVVAERQASSAAPATPTSPSSPSSPTTPSVPTSPTSPSSPSSPGSPGSTGTAPLRACYAYVTEDTGALYVVDHLGAPHLVRDECAWYQAGYPWPLSTAARCTSADVDEQAEVHGWGSDVCNNDDSGCPNPPSTFGCGYKGRYGFRCVSGSSSAYLGASLPDTTGGSSTGGGATTTGSGSACPDPEILEDGTTVYAPCADFGALAPISGTPCACGDGWDASVGVQSAAGRIAQGRLARGLMRSTAGVL